MTSRKHIRVLRMLILVGGTTAIASAGADQWWPATGTLILAGGGLAQDTAGLFVDRVIALAGGPDSQIVIIPTASVELPNLPLSGPQPAAVESSQRLFAAHGAKHIAFLHTRDRQTANAPEFSRMLRTANAVFFTGGAFRVLDDTYHDTLVEREIKAVLERGGLLAGDSAGSITLGCFWIGWNAATASAIKVSDGLCVLPRVTVTPHLERMGGDGRASDILSYTTGHPDVVGINIQENTFMVLRGGHAEVFGSGSVQIVDATKDKTKAYLRLSRGERYDFGR